MSVLDVNVSDSIAVLTLNRPEARNALSPELVVRLALSWQTIREDADIRVVVLTGAAGSTFCAGFDLAKTIPLFTGARSPADEWDDALLSDRTLTGRACLRDYDLKKPLIVAANGHAIAGGLDRAAVGAARPARRAPVPRGKRTGVRPGLPCEPGVRPAVRLSGNGGNGGRRQPARRHGRRRARVPRPDHRVQVPADRGGRAVRAGVHHRPKARHRATARRALSAWRYWSPARTDVMRWVLKPSQCIRPT